MDVSKWTKLADAPIPERKNALNRGPSPIGEALKSLKVGESFSIPVEIAASIKAKDERAKAFQEQARKVLSTISGTSRRISDKDAEFAFVCRVADDSTSVGVWRINPADKPARKPRTPKAVASQTDAQAPAAA